MREPSFNAATSYKEVVFRYKLNYFTDYIRYLVFTKATVLSPTPDYTIKTLF
jgi:hypothetical protein